MTYQKIDDALEREYRELVAEKLDLDLTRGKPSASQLDLSDDLLLRDVQGEGEGGDYRNYGLLAGIPEARRFFADFLGAHPEETYVLGNSSLAIMHDLVVQMLLRPPVNERDSLAQLTLAGQDPVFLCPVPGYDRHFAICEFYGITMIPIPMTYEGPDMRAVKRALAERNVYGMWCTPKYSNPLGITYARHVCEELANMQANPGFRIFWDLAYQVHHLVDEGDWLPSFLELCKKAGNPDRAFVIGSTAKITFAGSGVSMLASSKQNLDWYKKSLQVQTIGHDKLNQLRHFDFLHDRLERHMQKHRDILAPKFAAVDAALAAAFRTSDEVRWTKPHGGYFVSLFVKPGTASRVIEIAKGLGVKLTPAGSSYPYGKDPQDTHIRLAPSFPPLHEVETAMRVLILAIKKASGEKL